ncbi:MAG: DNA methyltransferase [Streptococcus salivarius]
METYKKIKGAFVSTNSINQGEQVALLWKTLLEYYQIFLLVHPLNGIIMQKVMLV